MRILQVKILNKTDDAPEVGSTVHQEDTLFVKQISDTEMKLLLSDGNGKVLAISNPEATNSSSTDTLKSIVSRENGNITNKELSFENEYPAKLGYSLGEKYNYWWGTGYDEEKDKNSEYSGTYNINIGANNNANGKKGSNNILYGHYNLYSGPQNSENNLLLGVSNLDSSTVNKAFGNIMLGFHNAGNSDKSIGNYTNNIAIGYNNDIGRTGSQRMDIPTDIVAKNISLLNEYDKQIYGYEAQDAKIDAVSNNITLGQKNNAYEHYTPTKSIGSINIGSGNTKGVYKDYFNIYLGNHINTHYVGKAQPQSYGNIIIGNFIKTWQDNGILAIHNSTEGFTEVQNSLIYGGFRDRFLKINGKLIINPTYAPQIDDTFNKVAIVNSSGEVGFKDLSSLAGSSPIKEEVVENGTLAFFRDRLKTTILKQGDLLYFEFKFTDMNSLSDVDTSQKAYIGELPSSITLTEDKVIYTSFGELHLEADGGRMHLVMYNTSMGDNYSVTAFTIL